MNSGFATPKPNQSTHIQIGSLCNFFKMEIKSTYLMMQSLLALRIKETYNFFLELGGRIEKQKPYAAA